MTNGSIPPVPPQEGSGDCASRHSHEKANENPQRDLPPGKTNAVGRPGWPVYVAEVVLAGAVGTGIWVLGEHLTSHGFTALGATFDFLAFATYFATLPISAVKIWPRPKLIWSLFGGFIALMAFIFITTSQPTGKKGNIVGWLPPELPKKCKDVVVWFGAQGIIYPLQVLTNNPWGPEKTSVPISQVPATVRTNLATMPGFSPRTKDVLFFMAFTNIIGGKIEDFYPVVPQVISNRLFVFVKFPLTNYQRLVMSDQMDAILTNCLPQSPDFWDWNYSSGPRTNVFEIVNENKNPIVQVIYRSPREVQVNGVFFVSRYDVQATFDGKYPLYFSFPNVKTNFPTERFDAVFTDQFGGILPTNQLKPGKHLFPIYQFGFGATNLIQAIAVEDVYAGIATNQKPIFRYPANIYPGEFAK